MAMGWTLWLLVAVGGDGRELGAHPYLSAGGCESAVREIAMASGIKGLAVGTVASTVRPTSSVTVYRKDGRPVTFSCRLDGDDTGE